MADGLGLEKISGVVMANQYADLESDSVLAADKTRLDVDGKTYNLDIKSELTDIGEVRHAYVHNGTEVLTELADENDNTVKENDGRNTTVEKLREELRVNDDTQYFTNFGTENGNHNSEWRLEWRVAFDRTMNGEATFNTEYANVRQLFLNSAFPANRITYDAASNTYTRVIFVGERITDADLDIMRGIFSAADNDTDADTPSAGISGYVLAGTNSGDNDSRIDRNNILSNYMTWRDFYAKYILSGEQKITECGNGNWLKIIDNNGDGVAEYVFLTEFHMTTVIGRNQNNSQDIWELEDGVNIDVTKDALQTPDGELAVGGAPVLYTKIDGVYWVNKPTPVKMTVAAGGITNKVGVKDDTLKGTDGETYEWSEIDHAAATYYDEVDYATAGISYDLYQDHFGFTRLFTESDGGFILLTDGYFNTDNRKEETFKAEIWDGEPKDINVLNPSNAPASVFISRRFDDADNVSNRDKDTWGRLIPFDDVYYGDGRTDRNPLTAINKDGKYDYVTNVAAYITDGDGSYTLGRVQERIDKLPYEAYAIDTTNFATPKAGDQILYGLDGVHNTTASAVRIQATTETKYYVVTNPGEATEEVVSWTGYKSPATFKGEIKRGYAVTSARNIDPNYQHSEYAVAEVVVFEAETKAETRAILAVALGNRQFGQRQQAVTGLTANGEEILDLLTFTDADAKSRTPHSWPDEVDELLEVYTYDKASGKITGRGSLDSTLYETQEIYAGHVVAVDDLKGVVTINKHSSYNRVGNIWDYNDRDPKNLVTFVRNEVKDYRVEYEPTADVSRTSQGNTAKVYRLANNNGDFVPGEMVIFMGDCSYVINVSNSTWNNNGREEIVPRLADMTRDTDGKYRGLYWRIWEDYENAHGNEANEPTVTVKSNNPDVTVEDVTLDPDKTVKIPYSVHQGKSVTVTIKAADKTTVDPKGPVTIKFDGSLEAYGKTYQVAVTVKGNPILGTGVDQDKETYTYWFTFEQPAGDTELEAVKDVIIVNEDNTFAPAPAVEAKAESVSIADFKKWVEAEQAEGKDFDWTFESSGGPIAKDDHSRVFMDSVVAAHVIVKSNEGKTAEYGYVKAGSGTDKAVVIRTDENVELGAKTSVIIEPDKDGKYVITAVTTEKGLVPTYQIGADGKVIDMDPDPSQGKAVNDAGPWYWKVTIDEGELGENSYIYVGVREEAVDDPDVVEKEIEDAEAALDAAAKKYTDDPKYADKVTDINKARDEAKAALKGLTTVKEVQDAQAKGEADIKTAAGDTSKDKYAVTVTSAAENEVPVQYTTSIDKAELAAVEEGTELTVTITNPTDFEENSLKYSTDGGKTKKDITGSSFKVTISAKTDIVLYGTKKATPAVTDDKILPYASAYNATARTATVAWHGEEGKTKADASDIATALTKKGVTVTAEAIASQIPADWNGVAELKLAISNAVWTINVEQNWKVFIGNAKNDEKTEVGSVKADGGTVTVDDGLYLEKKVLAVTGNTISNTAVGVMQATDKKMTIGGVVNSDIVLVPALAVSVGTDTSLIVGTTSKNETIGSGNEGFAQIGREAAATASATLAASGKWAELYVSGMTSSVGTAVETNPEPIGFEISADKVGNRAGDDAKKNTLCVELFTGKKIYFEDEFKGIMTKSNSLPATAADYSAEKVWVPLTPSKASVSASNTDNVAHITRTWASDGVTPEFKIAFGANALDNDSKASSGIVIFVPAFMLDASDASASSAKIDYEYGLTVTDSAVGEVKVDLTGANKVTENAAKLYVAQAADITLNSKSAAKYLSIKVGAANAEVKGVLNDAKDSMDYTLAPEDKAGANVVVKLVDQVKKVELTVTNFASDNTTAADVVAATEANSKATITSVTVQAVDEDMQPIGNALTPGADWITGNNNYALTIKGTVAATATWKDVTKVAAGSDPVLAADATDFLVIKSGATLVRINELTVTDDGAVTIVVIAKPAK